MQTVDGEWIGFIDYYDYHGDTSILSQRDYDQPTFGSEPEEYNLWVNNGGATYRSIDAIWRSYVTIDIAPVPEPATMLLFDLGLLGLAGVNRKK